MNGLPLPQEARSKTTDFVLTRNILHPQLYVYKLGYAMRDFVAHVNADCRMPTQH